jgi:hypothetical protein
MRGNTSLIAFGALFVGTLTGCSSVDSRGLVDSGAAVGAGGIAYEASGHNLPITAGAALGGGLLADVAQGSIANQKKTAAAQAYSLGQMDATKKLYWASRNLQKGASTDSNQRQVELVDIKLPAQETNGVKTEEQTITIPISKN